LILWSTKSKGLRICQALLAFQAYNPNAIEDMIFVMFALISIRLITTRRSQSVLLEQTQGETQLARSVVGDSSPFEGAVT
jgi:hypothetical protein